LSVPQPKRERKRNYPQRGIVKSANQAGPHFPFAFGSRPAPFLTRAALQVVKSDWPRTLGGSGQQLAEVTRAFWGAEPSLISTQRRLFHFEGIGALALMRNRIGPGWWS
jgi:hypothetical protein